jgi:hypothetical protein
MLRLCPFSLFLLLLLAAGPASATAIVGDFLGVFAGNDSASQIQEDLGLAVIALAKVETPQVSSGGLEIFDLAFKEPGEPVSGSWAYGGEETVDIIVVKAGNQYAVYAYNDELTGGMPNMGLWNTEFLDGKGMSHITAYRLVEVVPEPGVALLLGAAALAFARRR